MRQGYKKTTGIYLGTHIIHLLNKIIMSQMKLICEGCNETYDLPKTSEIPAHIFVIRCNWCPKCENTAQDYWEQWWDDDEDGNNGNPLPVPVPDNQLCLPFIFDEIGVTPHSRSIPRSVPEQPS